MSFLDSKQLNISSQKTTKKIIKKDNSLQAHTKPNKNAYTDILKTHSPKRMSPITLYRIKAGVSVEAAFAVPILVFFLVNIISYISLFDHISVALSEAQQQARECSFENHDINALGDNMTTVTKDISLNSAFAFMGFDGGVATVSISYRNWTGYDLSKGSIYSENEEFVYITEHGSSYHRSRACKHLNVNIEIISNSDIDIKRNSGGEKYRPCEKCGGYSTGVVFYTPDGNRYHSISNCSGLKRTIITIKLSDVGNRKGCKDCAN